MLKATANATAPMRPLSLKAMAPGIATIVGVADRIVRIHPARNRGVRIIMVAASNSGSDRRASSRQRMNPQPPNQRLKTSSVIRNSRVSSSKEKAGAAVAVAGVIATSPARKL
jgi:hypothetical protein